MARKRTQLDIEISRLQKNTRNKLSRLRKRGDVSDIDPRRITKNMTGSQKLKYAKELKAFNSRANAFVSQKNLVLLPKQKVQEYLKIQNKVNEQRAKLAAKIEKLGNIVPDSISIEEKSNLLASFDPKTGLFTRRRGAMSNDLIAIRRDEPFGSIQSLDRSIRMLKKQATRERNTNSNKIMRKNIYRMVDSSGDEALSQMVRELNNAQLNYLIYKTDFMENTLNSAYTAEGENAHDFALLNEDLIMSAKNKLYRQMKSVAPIRANYTIAKDVDMVAIAAKVLTRGK